MARKTLIATETRRYGTRMLTAGDHFTADGPTSRALVAIRLARPAAHLPQLDHDGDGKPGGSISPIDDIKALRAEYQAKLGRRPFPGWDADTLRERIAAA